MLNKDPSISNCVVTNNIHTAEDVTMSKIVNTDPNET